MGRFLRDIGQGFFEPGSFINLGNNSSTITHNEFFKLREGSCIVWLKVEGIWKQVTPFIRIDNQFLLDQFPGAEVGFSLRKLRSNYTGSAIRIRRSSDNAEQDIGFVNNVLDEAAIMSFCGTGEGHITTWYDQVGSKNFVQTVANDQPYVKIYTNEIEKVNGKPAIFFGYAPPSYDTTTYLQIASGQTLNFAETNYNTFIGSMYVGLMALNGPYYTLSINSSGDVAYNGSLTYYHFNPSSVSVNYNQRIITGLNDGSNSNTRLKVFVDGIEIPNDEGPTNETDNTITKIGGSRSGTDYFHYLQEIVFYNTNQETNRVSIEDNINAFYNNIIWRQASINIKVDGTWRSQNAE